jgi:rfaE bifunctional protein kinase chain/domain
LRALVPRLGDVKIGLVGDMIADVYVLGAPARLSREAPVVVVRFEEQRVVPGSAANTAVNAAAFGATVFPVGALGADEFGRAIRDQFAAAGVADDGLVTPPGFNTVTKTRILVGDQNRAKQQVVRIDRDPQFGIAAAAEEQLLAALARTDRQVSAWIVSDYEYGLVTPKAIEWLQRIAAAGKPVLVDSRRRMGQFCGVTSFTPNELEFEEYLGRSLTGEDDLRQCGPAALQRLEGKVLLVTRGNKGMALFTPGTQPELLPAVGSTEVTDVSGAGDTVMAGFACAFAAGASWLEAAWIANCAASRVVMKQGAASCLPEELLAAIDEAPL